LQQAVDKHLDALTKVADRHVVIEKGHVVWTGTSAERTGA
jgi:branched-chain amino acid transport system ATP-binding protein